MTSPWKTFRVSFAVRDCYEIDLKARSDHEAITRAVDLYDRYGEKPFAFDLSQGGTSDWDAQEVVS